RVDLARLRGHRSGPGTFQAIGGVAGRPDLGRERARAGQHLPLPDPAASVTGPRPSPSDLAGTPRESRVSEQSGTRRILVADDDPERLRALVDRLQREGFEVRSAQDGLEALDRAREELPDAIILNLLLRRIDGLRVCEILKSNPATTNIPVLLMAGVHVDADEGKRALAAGADRFLSDLSP